MQPGNATTAELYEQHAAQKGEMGPTIPFRYYNVIRNCGDAITSYILEKSFGLTGRVVEAKSDHLLAIGSIFFMANKNSNFWGSGVLDPKTYIPEINPTKIHALRGKKTVEHLRALGHAVPDVPLGDPGIFVDELVTAQEKAKYRAAIVPHHSSFHSPKWNAARESREFCLVDMMDDTLEPLRRIAESEVVISQSLHGLIFAAALGKPYLWISGHSDDIWNWKFRDWFSTCDNGQNEPILLNVPLDDMLRMADMRPCLSSKSDLKAAFPMGLADAAPMARGDFHANRLLSPARAFVDTATADFPVGEPYSPKAFAHHLGQVRSKVFRGAPEPTYLAISSTSAKHHPSRAALLDGQRYLDENRDAAFLWFKGDAPVDASPKFALSGLTLAEAYLQDGTVLLRPDGYMGLDRKFGKLK